MPLFKIPKLHKNVMQAYLFLFFFLKIRYNSMSSLYGRDSRFNIKTKSGYPLYLTKAPKKLS